MKFFKGPSGVYYNKGTDEIFLLLKQDMKFFFDEKRGMVYEAFLYDVEYLGSVEERVFVVADNNFILLEPIN